MLAVQVRSSILCCDDEELASVCVLDVVSGRVKYLGGLRIGIDA